MGVRREQFVLPGLKNWELWYTRLCRKNFSLSIVSSLVKWNFTLCCAPGKCPLATFWKNQPLPPPWKKSFRRPHITTASKERAQGMCIAHCTNNQRTGSAIIENTWCRRLAVPAWDWLFLVKISSLLWWLVKDAKCDESEGIYRKWKHCDSPEFFLTCVWGTSPILIPCRFRSSTDVQPRID